MSWQWPASVGTDLPSGQHLGLRALRRNDRAQWEVVRERNHDRLTVWEATVPGEPSTRAPLVSSVEARTELPGPVLRCPS